MAGYWLKLVGASDPGMQLLAGLDLFDQLGVERDSVGFPKHLFPRQMTAGDKLVYYAVGGTKTIFAGARLTGDPVKLAKPGDRWPHRATVQFDETTVVRDLMYAPKLVAVDYELDAIPKHETSHHPMTKQQYGAARAALASARQASPPAARRPLR